jgi:hypothetical protein
MLEWRQSRKINSIARRSGRSTLRASANRINRN